MRRVRSSALAQRISEKSMSRSRKKTPVRGITSAKSEKADKRDANRALRRRVRATLTVDPTPEVVPVSREVSNVWTMAKDGRHYLKNPTLRDLRK
jgi:hypothetical protein